MKPKYANPQIDMQLMSTCDVIQDSGDFNYTSGGSVFYNEAGSEGNKIALW